MNLFEGVGVALVTPFHRDGEIDYPALEKVINHVIDGHVDYLVTLGTTGESVALNDAEQQEVLAFTLKVTDGRRPVMAGIGGNDTRAVLKKIKTWSLSEADGILSVSPYYNRPSQEGIYQHFAAIAEASSKPVILYNVPSRTSSNISSETTLRLARDFAGKIIGIKEASGNFSQAVQLVKGRPDGFLLLSGDDLIAMPLISMGFDGVISVVANAFPREFSELIHYCQAGKFQDALPLQIALADRIELLFVENNPAGVKAFMAEMGLLQNHLRLPLVPLSEKYMPALRNLLQHKS